MRALTMLSPCTCSNKGVMSAGRGAQPILREGPYPRVKFPCNKQRVDYPG